jgi:A/G-specific adenine glycosylase
MIGANPLLARRLLGWYEQHRRDLPWRPPLDAGARDVVPYHVLVSEAMLQQTQVATVVPYFKRFIEAFPTVRALAEADEQQVLRLWQGLGYYSRARNLRKSAQAIVADHGGQVPADVESLRLLPGVGRYTAGAVASIAFGVRAPILDGNVARVLCRLDAIRCDPREKPTTDLLWARAEQILPKTRRRIGEFNSALMELGATVCTPRNPQCLTCPVREHCQAFAAGIQDRIPPPRKARVNPLLRRWTICVRRSRDGKWLIEQRPPAGRWASMWQFVTVEPDKQAALTSWTARTALSVQVDAPKRLGVVTHGLTHRRYEFDVYFCSTSDGKSAVSAERIRTWASLDELGNYPLPKPHVRIARMLRDVAT